MKPKRLFTPGPVQVPWQVLEKTSQPLIHHRTPEFREIFRQASESLQYVYKTTSPVLILTSSGSGALEAALVNLTRPGEKALITVIGKFSERWRDLAEAYGLDPVIVEAEWGTPVTPEVVEQAFADHPDISIMFTTHSETSTGVLQDVQSFSHIAHQNGALICVDGITSLCSEVVETDAWNLDVVVGGSQKGFMAPPGLAFMSVSDAARERMERRGHPVFYFDLKKALASYEKWDTPWTPALTLVLAVNEALRLIRDEGIENVVRRHARNAAAVRQAAQALDLPLLATVPSNCTTAVRPKNGAADKIRTHLENEYGIKVAGGQGHLKGNIIRLGHLGDYWETDMYTMISALDATLYDLNINDSVGKGVEALLQYFRNE
jgi:aspartate aminotransferase-like enzyme